MILASEHTSLVMVLHTFYFHTSLVPVGIDGWTSQYISTMVNKILNSLGLFLTMVIFNLKAKSRFLTPNLNISWVENGH